MAGGWKDRIALTGTEKKVFGFLLITFTVGLGIRFYRQTFPESHKFDYRTSDSTFAALSVALDKEPESRSVQPGSRVNLNEATKKQLMALPGIGEVTAERILLYREELGAFTSIDQLRKVKGMSKKKLEHLKPLITIR